MNWNKVEEGFKNTIRELKKEMVQAALEADTNKVTAIGAGLIVVAAMLDALKAGMETNENE